MADESKTPVDILVDKAASADEPHAAMQFAQAALNVANARRVEVETKRLGG